MLRDPEHFLYLETSNQLWKGVSLPDDIPVTKVVEPMATHFFDRVSLLVSLCVNNSQILCLQLLDPAAHGLLDSRKPHVKVDFAVGKAHQTLFKYLVLSSCVCPAAVRVELVSHHLESARVVEVAAWQVQTFHRRESLAFVVVRVLVTTPVFELVAFGQQFRMFILA